ncbi:hypothetical protein KH5H1_68160 [Corallococcus caeni]|nr:hypothetical protein KH5H1_68160 [Corallococcus sp. KH5-1]
MVGFFRGSRGANFGVGLRRVSRVRRFTWNGLAPRVREAGGVRGGRGVADAGRGFRMGGQFEIRGRWCGSRAVGPGARVGVGAESFRTASDRAFRIRVSWA